jgi:hypothetical protein
MINILFIWTKNLLLKFWFINNTLKIQKINFKNL